jgi:nitrogen regulatory protein P-II 1
MMRVEAIIRPQKVDDVREALRLAGVKAVTITEVRGQGKHRGITHNYRGAEYTLNLVPRFKVEIVLTDIEAAYVARVIAEAARTGEIGDGKIFLVPVADAVRIRTGEDGRDALE